MYFFDDNDTGVGGQRDRILSFTVPANKMIPSDVIDLEAIDANARLAGDQDFTWRGAGGFTAAGQIRWYESGTTRIIAGNTDNDAQAEFEIALVGLDRKVSEFWFIL